MIEGELSHKHSKFPSNPLSRANADFRRRLPCSNKAFQTVKLTTLTRYPLAQFISVDIMQQQTATQNSTSTRSRIPFLSLPSGSKSKYSNRGLRASSPHIFGSKRNGTVIGCRRKDWSAVHRMCASWRNLIILVWRAESPPFRSFSFLSLWQKSIYMSKILFSTRRIQIFDHNFYLSMGCGDIYAQTWQLFVRVLECLPPLYLVP